MNTHQCEQYVEWMSLAQDGMLGTTQSRLLHAHMDECAACRETWNAMTAVSRLFRAAPTLAPGAGFVQRFQDRLAYRQESRRRAFVWMLLGIGAIALGLLALPSIAQVLELTGWFVLPYPVIVYLQVVLDWLALVVSSLASAAGILIRYACTGPTAAVCLTLIAVAGAMVALWTKFLVGRLAGQRTR